MKTLSTWAMTLAVLACAAAVGTARGDQSMTLPQLERGGPDVIDLVFEPSAQVVGVGDMVQVDLIAHTSASSMQMISAIDAILNWSPTFLSLQSVSNPSGQWFVSDFLTDPDGVNDDLTDGDAIYNALPPASILPFVPPDLLVTTITFQALAETPGTDVSMAPTIGMIGETRVFGDGIQNNVTGDISSVATITIVPEPSALCLLLGGALLIGKRSGMRRTLQ